MYKRLLLVASILIVVVALALPASASAAPSQRRRFLVQGQIWRYAGLHCPQVRRVGGRPGGGQWPGEHQSDLGGHLSLDSGCVGSSHLPSWPDVPDEIHRPGRRYAGEDRRSLWHDRVAACLEQRHQELQQDLRGPAAVHPLGGDAAITADKTACGDVGMS